MNVRCNTSDSKLKPGDLPSARITVMVPLIMTEQMEIRALREMPRGQSGPF